MSESILVRLLAAVPDNYQKTIGFPTYDLLAAAALRMAEVDQRQSNAEDALNPANLTGDTLEAYIEPRSGLSRVAATKATGTVTVTGTGTVHAGDLFESAGGVQFAAAQNVTASGMGEVPVVCVTAGSAGNLPAGSITMMPVQLDGIVSVTNQSATAEGYDAETDEAYYDRFLIRLRTPPTSGNQYHYRLWALEVPGVGDVQIYPLGHGANTVDVVVIDTDKQPASAALVEAVQTHIDPGSQGIGAGEAPMGAHCYVSAAAAVAVDLSVTVTALVGAEQTAVTQAIRDAVSAYLASVAFAQSYVSYARIGEAILSASGVQDYTGLLVNGGTGNQSVAARQVAVLGEVSVSYAGG